jgi:hypothetical protein
MGHKSQRMAVAGEAIIHGKLHYGRLEKKLHDLETSSFTQYKKKIFKTEQSAKKEQKTMMTVF